LVFTGPACDAVNALVIRAIVLAIPIGEDAIAIRIAKSTVPLAYVSRLFAEERKHANRGTSMQRTRAVVVEIDAYDATVTYRALVGRLKHFRGDLPPGMEMNCS